MTTNFEGEPLDEKWANAIFDVLIEEAGASESMREEFVYLQTHEHVMEFRFQGLLGFGGKFWRRSRTYGRGETWTVTCYAEHDSPERNKLVEATNKALKNLRDLNEEET